MKSQKLKMIKRLKKDQSGIALILVMWTLVLLFALGAEFAFSMKTEVNSTKNFKEDIESYHLARAGINMAMAEIIKKAYYHSHDEKSGFIFGYSIPSPENANEVTEPLTRSERTDIPLGKGSFSYTIIDKNGKIGVNSNNRKLLANAIEASGVIDPVERDIIADSILDWIDPDDLHKLNGAEKDFYENKTGNPKPRNGPIEHLDELLMVRGITPEILYGSSDSDSDGSGSGYLGLDKFLTAQKIYSFNPNTADPKVLAAVYPETKAQEIFDAKSEKGFSSATLSSHFRIVSTGKMNDSETSHTIVALIEKRGVDHKASLLIRYWKDNEFES